MRIDRVCVLGGTGFVGTSFVSRLITSGKSVRVLTRSRERHRGLWVLPRLALIEGDVHDEETLTKAASGCQAMVNLVGILNERGDDGSGFRQVHVELARKAIAVCRRLGIKRLLHMSALNADPRGPSHYLRSKGEAEELVHAATGLSVTSFRPSVIFGPDDSFINRFAGLLKLSPGVFPLACAQARFAPVYVRDVGQVMADALDDAAATGLGLDLCGPRDYSLADIVRYLAKVMGLKRLILPLPDWMSRMQAEVLEHLPGKPFSRDNYRSLKLDSVCPSGERCPTPLEAVVPDYVRVDPAARLKGRA